MTFKTLVAAVPAVLFAGAVSAATVNLAPTADGDAQKFGGDNVDVSDTILAFTQSGGLIRNAIMEFDLSSIADTATINSASLTVTLNRFVSNIGPAAAIDLFGYNGDGVVDIADFDAAGTQVFDGTTPTGGARGDTRTFNFSTVAPITSALMGDLLTLRLETDSFASIQIGALENATVDAVVLTVDYTSNSTGGPAPIPLPAGMPLLLAGLGCLAVLRRRKGA